jgi:hypothetical protein
MTQGGWDSNLQPSSAPEHVLARLCLFDVGPVTVALSPDGTTVVTQPHFLRVAAQPRLQEVHFTPQRMLARDVAPCAASKHAAGAAPPPAAAESSRPDSSTTGDDKHVSVLQLQLFCQVCMSPSYPEACKAQHPVLTADLPVLFCSIQLLISGQ